MRTKKLLALLLVVSVVFGNVAGGGNRIFAKEEGWDEILGEDLPEEILDDDVIIEEDEDYENYASMGFDETGAYDVVNETEIQYDVSEEELENALYELEKKEISIEYSVTAKWDRHYNVNVTLRSIFGLYIQNWEIKLPFPDEIENIWNARITGHVNGIYYIKNAGWNKDIEENGSVTFGMTVACDDSEKVNIPERCGTTKECEEVETEYDLDYKEYSRWDNMVIGEITIFNRCDREIEDWKLELETDLVFKEVWDAEIEETDDYYCYLDNKGDNANIPPNGSVTFGFIAECGEESEISEYYLYEMANPIDEESWIIYELESGEMRDDEDFNTKEEYAAYQIVRSYYITKLNKEKLLSLMIKRYSVFGQLLEPIQDKEMKRQVS